MAAAVARLDSLAAKPLMASLSDKAALLILANTLKYAVGFALPMVLVRHLTQDDYGTYQQLSLIANFATGIMVPEYSQSAR